MKEYTVTFLLDRKQQEQLERITALWSQLIEPAAPETVIDRVLQLGQAGFINQIFDYTEKNFTANLAKASATA